MTHAHTQINQWLKQIHPALGLDQNGGCVIAAGENRDLELFAAPNADEFLLSTKLMSIPGQSNGGFFMKVLSMNLFMQETRGATIACDEQAGELVLCLNQSLEGCDLTLFQNILQNFARTAQTVHGRLAQMEVETQPLAGPPSQFTGYQQPLPPQEPVYEHIDPMSCIAKLV